MEPATRSTILNNLVTAIHKQAKNLDSIFNAKALAVLSSVYLTLVTKWSSNLSGQWLNVKHLVDTLEAILDSEDTPLLGRCQAAMMGALTNVLRHRRLGQTKDKQGIDLSLMERLLPPICVALQHSKTYHKPKSSPQPPNQEAALDITMEDLDRTVGAEELALRTQGDKVVKVPVTVPIQLPVVAAYLLDEVLLIQADQPDKWMPLVREHSVVSLLLSTLQACLQAKKGLHYVEAVMVLLKDLAGIPPAAEAVRITGYIQHTCLSLVWLHDNAKEQDYAWSKKSKGDKKPDGTSWLSIYVESITVTANLLATLSHAFLTDALDFFGVHRERMMKCLESVYLLQSPLQLEEAQATTTLVYQLAHHARQWRFQMPTELALLQETLARLTQSCVALLIRPRLLQHMLEMKTNAKDSSQSQHITQTIHTIPRRLLQHQVSTDQSDASISDDAQEVQSRLLVIMGRTLASFRLFSPDLLESLLNQSLDVSEYPMLYCLGFSTPSLDQKTPASFGTLISCINWCLQMLPKLDVTKSPMKLTEQKNTNAAPSSDTKSLQRPVLLFVLENAVHLIMAQGMRTLRDPAVPTRDRQLLKRELGSELNTFLISLQRYFRRGKPGSPSDASPGSSSARLASSSASSVMSKASLNAAFSEAKEQYFFKVVHVFVQQLSK